MSTVKLTFVNESNDANNSEIVIFQKNGSATDENLVIAWTVIKNCATGWKHPFNYPATSGAGAKDSWGNQIISPLVASNGDAFKVFKGPSGDQMGLDAAKSKETPANEIRIYNDLEEGAINAQIYKDGRLLLADTGMSPAEFASFSIKPILYIGVVSEVEEGDVMSSAIVSQINTELSLVGVASADIVMTGGGHGTAAEPFQFTLKNVVMA